MNQREADHWVEAQELVAKLVPLERIWGHGYVQAARSLLKSAIAKVFKWH